MGFSSSAVLQSLKIGMDITSTQDINFSNFHYRKCKSLKCVMMPSEITHIYIKLGNIKLRNIQK